MNKVSSKKLTEQINNLEYYVEKYRNTPFMFGGVEFYIKRINQLKLLRSKQIGKK